MVGEIGKNVRTQSGQKFKEKSEQRPTPLRNGPFLSQTQNFPDFDQPWVNLGLNSSRYDQTWEKFWAKFVRTGQPSSPTIFGGPSAPRHCGVEWTHACRKRKSGPGTWRHPGCRAPIPSKGKQRFGALSSVERSIELTTAVVHSPRFYHLSILLSLSKFGSLISIHLELVMPVPEP